MSDTPTDTPRILAVDDTPANLTLLVYALQPEFQVILCASASEALERLAKERFDLILLDIMMPGISGFEAVPLIRALPSAQNTPIVFISALNDRDNEERGLALGAIDFIFKPIRVSLVKLRIRNILRVASLSRALQASEERLRLVMDATGEGIWDWDVASGLVQHNAAWYHILGLNSEEGALPVQTFIERVHPEDLPTLNERLADCVSGTTTDYISEHRLRHADGHYVWVADRGKVVTRDDEGRARRVVGSMRNIDELKRNEEERFRLAFFDPLTGLPNRRLLLDRLQQALAVKQRTQDFGALMFLDMDHFKELNDTHGHAMGDALLTTVADRLRQSVRHEDTVSRFGGDEFVVLVSRLGSDPDAALKDATAIAEKLLATLNQPYQLGSLTYPSTPSIGLTLFSARDVSHEEVIRRADSAMYRAKNEGRNTLRIAC